MGKARRGPAVGLPARVARWVRLLVAAAVIASGGAAALVVEGPAAHAGEVSASESSGPVPADAAPPETAAAGRTPAGGAAAGDEAAADVDTARIGPVVVTATRIEQPAAEVGSAVTVITGEELRRRGIEFVADALQEVPGVTVPRSGTRGKTTSLFLRGANANQTLVLIDGIRVNDPTSGSFDLAFLTTDNVERIEVIRGPQSPLYGSEAVGGVVNIITRRGRGPIATTLTALGGNYDTYSVGAAIRGGGERLGGSLEVSRFATDNRAPNDDFDVDTVSARLDGRLTDRLSSTITFRRSIAETGTPGQLALGPPVLTDRQENELSAAGITVEHRTTSIWSQRLSLSGSDQTLLFTQAAGLSITDSERRSIEWVHTITPLRPLSLVVGGEYRGEDGAFQNPFGTDFEAHLVTRALFAQAQLVTLGERLFLQGGGRLDDGTQLDTEVTPKVAAAFLVPETGTRLHASWGKGIKAPTILDLFFPGFSNPDLKPERSTGWDAGVDQRLWGRRVEVGVTFFRNDFKDLIVFDPFLFIPVNVGKAHSYGVESTLAVRPTRWLDLAVAHTYLEAINDDTQTRLLRRPRHQGSAQVTLRPAAAASVTVSGLYVGDRRDNTFTPGSQERDQGEYFRLDASATYRLPRVPGVRSLEVVGRVENILDREYEEVAGFPALGTSFLAGVRGTF